MDVIKNKQDFKGLVSEIESRENYRQPWAFAIGLATTDSTEEVISVSYPFPNLQSNFGSAAILINALGLSYRDGVPSYVLKENEITNIITCFSPFMGDGESHPNIESLESIEKICITFNHKHEDAGYKKKMVVTFLNEDVITDGVKDIPSAFLVLHLLSHRLIKPNHVTQDGMFGVLKKLAWTSEGPITLEDLPFRKIAAEMTNHPIHVYSEDKFPQMTDFVVPDNVRIADASRVRLGAYLGDGTVVMHAGFVNFNSGCEGPNMIEGRISNRVWVGANSDLGGGCSTMGTLSGGNDELISVGRNTLIGANAGTGIVLGDNCIIEAGLYVTAVTPVLHISSDGEEREVLARELSGIDGLLFYCDGKTGQVTVKPNKKAVVLNEELHANS